MATTSLRYHFDISIYPSAVSIEVLRFLNCGLNHRATIDPRGTDAGLSFLGIFFFCVAATLHGAPQKKPPIDPGGDAEFLFTSSSKSRHPTMISATPDEPLHGDYLIYTRDPVR